MHDKEARIRGAGTAARHANCYSFLLPPQRGACDRGIDLGLARRRRPLPRGDHLSVIRKNGCVWARAPYIGRYGPSASPLFPMVTRPVCIGFDLFAELASRFSAGRLRTTKVFAKDVLQEDHSKQDLSKRDFSKRDLSKRDLSKRDLSKRDLHKNNKLTTGALGG